MKSPHKEILLEDLGLTPEEMKTLVQGSQRFLPAREEDGSLADVSPLDIDNTPERRTS